MSAEHPKYDIHTTAGKIADLEHRRHQSATRRKESVDKQHAKGKLTAMERIEQLLDKLVEKGVRFIQLYNGTWDSHDYIERAHGNLIRGVPLTAEGWFSLSLFETLSPYGPLGTLDWFTVLAGVLALVVIAHHGALFLAWKTDGPVHARSEQVAGVLFPAVIGLWGIATVATMAVFTAERSSRPTTTPTAKP